LRSDNRKRRGQTTVVTDPRQQAMELVWAALGAVNPARAVARVLRLDGPTLRVGEWACDLSPARRLIVVGAGKASAGMAAAAEALLGEHIAAGWVNVPHGYEPAHPSQRITVHPAGHPIPDEASLEGTQRILNLVDGLEAGDLALVLLSGGASALLEQSAPGVSLADLRALTDHLLRCGATIQEINTVRRHLSQVKGGRLAQRIAARGAQAIVLLLSDVVGSPLEAVGSGPCAPDPTTFADAWGVLEQRGLLADVRPAILEHLRRGQRGEVEETLKPGDPTLARVEHVIVGDNRAAALAAVERARALGYHALLLTTHLEGEARQVGQFLAALAKEEARHAAPLPHPACLVLGGETTVTVRGEGRGGRNQEVALGAALALEGWTDVLVMSLATDGVDGPTDAAGAIATGETVARARALGLDPADHLARNDAYPLFAALGDLVLTGPTGTNVNDLFFVLVSPSSPRHIPR